ncbi:MAG TPA: hypothetical protein VH744_01690, partial [Terriglobales bacterium]
GPEAWGLTASDGPAGYVPHQPDDASDKGTLTLTGSARIVSLHTGNFDGGAQALLSRPGRPVMGHTARAMRLILARIGFRLFIWD